VELTDNALAARHEWQPRGELPSEREQARRQRVDVPLAAGAVAAL
jgi:hypothetical protein